MDGQQGATGACIALLKHAIRTSQRGVRGAEPPGSIKNQIASCFHEDVATRKEKSYVEGLLRLAPRAK